MKLKSNFLVCLLGLGLFAATAPAYAQTAADKVDEWRRAREEYLKALQAKEQVTTESESLQRNIDLLTQRKAALERELNYTRSKLDNANRQLVLATNANQAEDMEKYKKEVQVWDGRVKTSEAELAQVESDLQAKIVAVRRYASGAGATKVLIPGDSIQLFVVEDDSFNGLYQVREGGYVILPRIGRVQIAGKDLSESEKAIKQALEASQLRQATVMVERTAEFYTGGNGNIVYLAGEFGTTGPLVIPAGYSPTITTIIIRSGGVKDSGDLTRVKLLRLAEGKSLVEEVNVQAILDGVGLTPDVAVNPGDIVVVPAFANRVYVTGNVKTPGILKLPTDEELTAYAAVLRSGGFARFAKKSGVYVLRNRGNGEKVRIPVNIKSVQAGKQADVILQSNDIVVVPESFFSF